MAEAKLAAEAAARSGDRMSEDGDEDSEASMEESEEETEAAQVDKAKAFAAMLKKSGAPEDTAGVDSAMAELNMDTYDEEEGGDGGVRGIFGNTNPGMAYYGADQEDPYIQLAAVKDEDSEAEDFEIRGDDYILLAARNEDDVSHLEVWVYEEADEVGGPSNLYVHHDILLPAFPLAVAWTDCSPSGRVEAGNFAAVGTMSPGVEIWDLDVTDSVEPLASLGGELPGGKEPKARKKAKKGSSRKAQNLKEGSHSDAVLSLAWNPEYRNVVASGSADRSVKVWDLATQSCQATLQWHADKVQAVCWNPSDAPIILSGGFDKRACLGDSRAPGSHLAWEVSADVEAIAWDPSNPTHFLVSSEDGLVAAFDARSGGGSAPLYRLSAHDKPACCLSFNPAAKGLLATASTDKQVKLWDVSEKPSLVASQDLKVGALFAASFCAEQPSFYAAGGAKGEVVVWDILSSAAVVTRYGKELGQFQQGATRQGRE